MCDRQSPRRGRFARSEVAALWHGEGELAQRPADLRGLALHLVETVDRFHRHDNCVFDAPRDFSPFDLLFGEIDHRLVGAGFVEQLYRGAHCGTKLALAEVSLFAQANEQNAVGERSADVVQQQRAAQFPLHVAAADDLADISPRSAIDQLRGKAGLAVVEDADDHAGAALLLRAAAFYGKFHRRSHAR